MSAKVLEVGQVEFGQLDARFGLVAVQGTASTQKKINTTNLKHIS